MNRSTRCISVFLLGAIVLSQLVLPPAVRAQIDLSEGVIFDPSGAVAIIPAGITPDGIPIRNLTIETDTQITAGASKTSALQKLFEWFMRFVRETLRKQLLDMIVQQIIQWIQGGGSPKFVTDWEGFLEDAANVSVGQFLNELADANLCQPFRLQIKLGIRAAFSPSNNSFSRRVTCTLDQIVGNVENFARDFRNGEWLAFQTSLQPQNNAVGAALIARAELSSRVANAQFSAYAEAQAGGGFLGTKDCAEAYGPWPQGQAPPDLDRDGTPGDIPQTCRITTPGSTIGALVSKAVGSDIDYIISAEELEAYVAAIADAAINRLIGLGAQGLAGLFTSAEQGPGYNPPITGSGCIGLTGAAATACNEYQNPNFNLPTQTGVDKPQNVAAIAASPSEIRLLWTDLSSSETNYAVERASSASGPFTAIAPALPADTVTYQDLTVTPGATRYYRIIASNATATATSTTVNETPPTNANANVSVTNGVNFPSAFAGIAAVPVNANTVNIAWTDVFTNEDGFRVQRSKCQNFSTSQSQSFCETDLTYASPGANTPFYTDQNAQPGTNYFYRIRAFRNTFTGIQLSDPSSVDNAITPYF